MKTTLVETIVERQIGGNFPHLSLLDEFALVKIMLVEILPIISSCQGMETAPVLKRL